MKRKCSAITNAGRPCRAWAMRDSDPPLCPAHAGANQGAGAPAGNQNARKHGFYSQHFTRQELADLVTLAGDPSLDDEIALARVALRRLFNFLNDEDDLTPREMGAIGPLIFTGTRAVAELLRHQRAISGEAADGISGAIAQALDELSTEWGVEL